MLLERMFDFLTVLVLFGLSVAVTKRSPPELEPVAWFVGGAGVLMLLVSLAFLWWTEAFISAVSLVIKLLPRRIPNSSWARWNSRELVSVRCETLDCCGGGRNLGRAVAADGG